MDTPTSGRLWIASSSIARPPGRARTSSNLCIRDLRFFADWILTTNSKPLSPERITPIDVRKARSRLLTVKNYRPAPVNRKLISPIAFCEWAGKAGLISASPMVRLSCV